MRILPIFMMLTLLLNVSVSVFAQQGLTMLTKVRDMYPRWSADQQTIWFFSNRLGTADIYKMKPDGSEIERVVGGEQDEVLPAPSPDGRSLSYTVDDENEDVWVMDLQSGKKRNLTRHEAQDTDASWSAQSDKIIFVSNRSGNYDVWEMSPQGSELKQLTDSPQREGTPSFSPDGRYIAFQRTMAQRDAEIFVKNLKTGEERNLSNWNGGWDGWPSWSPDGKSLLFSSNRGGSTQLWQVNIEGDGSPSQVTNIPGIRVRRAHWSSDGNSVLTNLESPSLAGVFVGILESPLISLQ